MMCYDIFMSNCSFLTCERPVDAVGLCQGHYAQKRRGKEFTSLRNHASQTSKTCSFDDCERASSSKGFCDAHYRQQYRGEQLVSLINPPVGRRGAGRKTGSIRAAYYSNGYKIVYRPEHPNARKSGYLAEHTFIMSEFLGRALLEHENVHHKNGVRDDNRLENLELWSTSQPYGQRVEDKIEWAKHIIALYKPLFD